MKTLYLLSAATAVGAMAVPASAQQAYPYPQQTYPQQGYPQQAYPGYPQTYPQQNYAQPGNPIEQIIGQLLGNRYNVSDRTAVTRCATAAVAQAQAQYGSRNGAYGQQGYGYDQRYANNRYNNAYSQMRVTSITDVQRRSNNGLRVTGLISTGAYAAPYGNAYGYQNQGYTNQRYADPRYAQVADLSFRCNVDYRGAVSGVRISRNQAGYRR
jgi:hypothetical protein